MPDTRSAYDTRHPILYGVLIVALCLSAAGCRGSGSPMRRLDGFVALNRLARDVEALTGDTDQRLNANSLTPEQTRAILTHTHAELVSIQTASLPLRMAPLLQAAKTDFQDALQALLQHHEARLSGDTQTRDAAFERFRIAYENFLGEVNSKAPGPRIGPEALQAASRPRGKHAGAFQAALARDAANDVAGAYAAMQALAETVKGGPLEQQCALQMARWLIDFESSARIPGIKGTPVKAGIARLETILSSKAYSPVVYEAFLRWRTAMQLYEYGMLKGSVIPNRLYNDRRDQTISRVRRQLRRHPGDDVAWFQLRGLVLCPNIERIEGVNSALFDDQDLNLPVKPKH